MIEKLKLVCYRKIDWSSQTAVRFRIGVNYVKKFGFKENAYCGLIDNYIFISNEPFNSALVAKIRDDIGEITIPLALVGLSGMKAKEVAMMVDPKNNDLFIVPKSA